MFNLTSEAPNLRMAPAAIDCWTELNASYLAGNYLLWIDSSFSVDVKLAVEAINLLSLGNSFVVVDCDHFSV